MEECQKSCQKDPDCNAFTVRDLNCHFHFKDGFKVYAGSSYVTGPKTCPGNKNVSLENIEMENFHTILLKDIKNKGIFH